MYTKKQHIVRKTIIVSVSFLLGIVSTVIAAATYDANIQARATKMFATIKSNASTLTTADQQAYYTLVHLNIQSLIQVLTSVDSSLMLELGTTPDLEDDVVINQITNTGATTGTATSTNTNTTTNTNSTGTQNTTQNNTNSSSVNSSQSNQTQASIQGKQPDEKWNYGFYVIKSTTDYDGDSELEGCNEDGLDNPENLCVLKIDNMYVSPVNFTLKAYVNNTSNLVEDFARGSYYITNTNFVNSLASDKRTNLDKYGLSVVDNTVFDTTAGNCHQELVDLENRYKDSSGRITDSAAYYAEWNRIRNNGTTCSSYDRQSKTYYENVVGKNVFGSDSSCETLFSITSYKEANANNGVTQSTIGNKKWIQLMELGGDGISNTCSISGSNKKGLCSLELNKSKLQFLSDGLYYGTQNAIINGNPFATATFVSIGDGMRIKSTPVYKQKPIQRWNPDTHTTEYLEVDDTGIVASYKLSIAGNTISSVNVGNNKFYARCVAY